MGLDMYLTKVEDVDNYDFSKQQHRADKIEIVAKVTFPDGEVKEKTLVANRPEFSAKIGIPVMYWRKANAIHNWFVEQSGEEDECQEIEITGEQLLELVEICKKILKNHTLADKLLPTTEGFFFGSTDYDDAYYEDLKDTVEALENCNPDDWYVYRASW